MADDPLQLDLHAPMLDGLMQSQFMYEQIRAIAEAIKNRWVDTVAVQTGELKSTAAVSMHHDGRDQRWEGVFQAGGPRADYAGIHEAEAHELEHAIMSLGFDPPHSLLI